MFPYRPSRGRPNLLIIRRLPARGQEKRQAQALGSGSGLRAQGSANLQACARRFLLSPEPRAESRYSPLDRNTPAALVCRHCALRSFLRTALALIGSLASGLWASAQTPAPASLPTLTTIKSIRALSQDEGAQGLPRPRARHRHPFRRAGRYWADHPRRKARPVRLIPCYGRTGASLGRFAPRRSHRTRGKDRPGWFRAERRALRRPAPG